MQQAVYSPHNVGHFGLAYEAYTHFTSPIRRYPDLLVHRSIKAILARRSYVPSVTQVDLPAAPLRAPPRGPRAKAEEGSALAAWEKLGLICSANERRADDATRDVEAWLKSYYMRERVGETYSGTISAVVPFGIFVVLDDLFVEGLVHVSELGSEYFNFNEALHELRGERTGQRYRLSDRLTVQVSRVDLEGRRIEFRLVRPSDRRALRGEGAPDHARKSARKGESVEERNARRAAVAARKGRDIDKREKARSGGKRGLGGLRPGKTRRRGH
jgi:ribonuclease R